MDNPNVGLDVFFVLLGAILVFAMHGGFAFLEVGTVRHKNQVNALVKIIADFAFSTLAYFIIGYTVAYGAASPSPRRASRSSNSSSLQPSPPRCRPSFRAASPSGPNSGRR